MTKRHVDVSPEVRASIDAAIEYADARLSSTEPTGAVVQELLVDLPFLVPGVGAQGGDAAAAVEHGLAGGVGLVNSSRGIVFAGEGAADENAYFRAAGEAAKRLKRRLNEHR